MMPNTVYEYSQLCCIVETLVLGVFMMFVGHSKIQKTAWLKRAKWAIVIVLLLVGLFTLVQYCFNMNRLYPRYNTVFNLTLMYCITMVLAAAYIPIANKQHMTRTRVLLTSIIFATCCALAWVSTIFDSSLATIALVGSLTLYLFELVRITVDFIVSFKLMDNRQLEQEGPPSSAYLGVVSHCLMVLSLYALFYVFLVLWSDGPLAIFNFATLPLWAYLCVSFTNLLINFEPNGERTYTQNAETKIVNLSSTQISSLKEKVNRWVSSQAYCEHGVTMNQVAGQLGTNRTYLSHYINSTYGCNFSTWLTQLRIEEAKRQMLLSPTLSIDKIALQVGFASKSHFMSSFKSMVGTTPGQWRENNWSPAE